MINKFLNSIAKSQYIKVLGLQKKGTGRGSGAARKMNVFFMDPKDPVPGDNFPVYPFSIG